MKITFYLNLLLVIMVTLQVQAQNYNPIVNGNNSLFQLEADNKLYAMHVDSITSDSGKEIFHFLKTIVLDNYCYSNNYLPAWTGPKMLKDGDAYYFFNRNEDSIKLLPLQPLGTTWKLYQYTDGSYIEATISSKDQLTFLSLTDSVKTISLQLKDASDVIVTSPINSKTIQLSKNYGLISLVAFDDFPNSYPTYELKGLSNPETGLQLLTPRKIYNFDVNDEFHYEEFYVDAPTSYDTKRILKITDKYISSNTDTVRYTISDYSEVVAHHYFPTSPDTYSYTANEYVKEYIFNDSILYPANHKIHTDLGLEIEKITLTTGNDPIGKSVQHIYDTQINDEDPNCNTQVVDGYVDNLDLLEGVGTFSHHWAPGLYFNYENLVYYKKENEMWGTPLILSTYSQKTNEEYTLFPNPLKQGERLQVQTSHFQMKQVIVYNNVGTKVLEYNSDSTLESIDVSALPAGLYMIQLINGNNELMSNKFIIR